MPGIKHLLFDCDGTIVDSEIIAVRIMLRLLQPYGLEISERDYSQRFPGLREREILTILREEYRITPADDFMPRLRAEFVRRFDQELRAVPGMHSLFRRLKTPRSMVSNGSVQHVERSLRRVRLRHALDGQIFSAEQVERPKPHPDVYQLALRELRLQPSETLAVEDSPTGVQSASQAGLYVIGFLGATHIHDGHREKLESCGAHSIAADAAELNTIFKRLGVN